MAIEANRIETYSISFEVDDVESEWTHTPDSFDLIYSRYMLGSIQDWPRLFRQAYKALKPGGYLELLEPDATLRCDDGSLPPECHLAQWNNLFIDAAKKAGRPVTSARDHATAIKEAGYVDIHENILKLPNSPWAKDRHHKEVGGYHMANFLEALEGLSLRLFTHFHSMSVEEIQVLLAHTRKDLRNKAIHTYFNLSVCPSGYLRLQFIH
ncbi:hypothetical protein ABW21_db0205833 [Orbilia brochopaga]|nr:hypothetical protein ABW21_db0205833 [Drechslerella brochopaga]